MTDSVSGRLLRLPFFTNLTDADAERGRGHTLRRTTLATLGGTWPLGTLRKVGLAGGNTLDGPTSPGPLVGSRHL